MSTKRVEADDKPSRFVPVIDQSQDDAEKLTDGQNNGTKVPVSDQRRDLVVFDGPDDPENPLNWPKSKKWAVTMAMGAMTFVVTFSSSIYVSLSAF